MVFEDTFFHQILDDPPVFVITTGWMFPSGMEVCLERSKGRPCRVLVQCYWHVPHILTEIEDFKAKADPKYRHLAVTYMCNTKSDADMLLSKGVDALHIHQNAFIDERIFAPIKGVEKKYAAVHNANCSVKNFKRHHLAWGVKQIALVTYAVEHIKSAESIAGYKDMAFINAFPDGKIDYIDGEAVNRIVNQARCGLILSEIEGANYASTEYLLCGLPVVSTPSLGGRDEFFDPRHVKIVDPDPGAVERAVAEWNENAPAAEEIRESALRKSKMFRARMLHWLSAISGRDLFQDADENLWSPLFIDKLRAKVSVPLYRVPITNDPTTTTGYSASDATVLLVGHVPPWKRYFKSLTRNRK